MYVYIYIYIYIYIWSNFFSLSDFVWYTSSLFFPLDQLTSLRSYTSLRVNTILCCVVSLLYNNAHIHIHASLLLASEVQLYSIICQGFSFSLNTYCFGWSSFDCLTVSFVSFCWLYLMRILTEWNGFLFTG